MRALTLSVSDCLRGAIITIIIIVLPALANDAGAATRTWTGTNGGFWSDPGNWGGTTPVAGDDLVFPSGALNQSTTNDLSVGTVFHSITLAEGYVLSGNAIGLDAGGLLASSSSTVFAAFNLDVTLIASQTWSVPNGSAQLFINSFVRLNGQTFTLDVPLFNGGHESAGVTAPSTNWFLAEGATGSFFETFLLLANPGDTDAVATLT
jgi:hypothetical protein